MERIIRAKGNSMMNEINRSIIALCFPLLIDVFLCGLQLRRNRKGAGAASTVPILTLFFYALLIIYCPLNLIQKLLAFFASVVIHILLLFVIPYYDAKRLERKS